MSDDDSLDSLQSPTKLRDRERGRGDRDEVLDLKRASRLTNARSKIGSTARGGLAPRNSRENGSLASAGRASVQLQEQQDDMLRQRQNSQQFEEAKWLRQQLDERDREVKECRYEIKQLQSRLNVLQSSEKSLEMKIANATATLKHSCEVAERTLEDRKTVVQSECDRLIRLVSGIERHTMHGHHAVASRTTIGLLLKTRHGLENLKRAVLEGSSVVFPTGQVEIFESSMSSLSPPPPPSAVSTSGGNLKVKADALDGALLDMCKHLEEENTRIESAYAVAQAELEDLRRESAASKLIPHYRLAIVRARAHSTNLADQLKRTQDDNRVLRDQLEKALKDMSNNSVTDLKRSAIFDFLTLKSSSGGGDTPTSSLLLDPAAAGIQAKVVQKELADLDSEIDLLKARLQAKAKEKASTILSANS